MKVNTPRSEGPKSYTALVKALALLPEDSLITRDLHVSGHLSIQVSLSFGVQCRTKIIL